MECNIFLLNLTWVAVSWSSRSRSEQTDVQSAETCLGSGLLLLLPSVSDHGSLLFSPLVLTVLFTSLLLVPRLWFLLAPMCGHPPHTHLLLTLPVFPWGAGINLITSATQIGIANPITRYQEICIRMYSHHLTPKKLIIPAHAHMFLSPMISLFLGMVWGGIP